VEFVQKFARKLKLRVARLKGGMLAGLDEWKNRKS
jgi:hypothetical protein